jgi:large subunit ribosomal protein L25
VPLHFVGEEHSPAVKTDKCLVNHVMSEVEIECLANAAARVHHGRPVAPEEGPVVHARDLKLPPASSWCATARQGHHGGERGRAEARGGDRRRAGDRRGPKGKAAKGKKDEKQNKK